MRAWSPFLLCACLFAEGPELLSVEPPEFDAQQGAALTVRGARLLPPLRFDFDQPEASELGDAGVTAFLSREDGTHVALTQVTWVDATQVTAQVGAVEPGAYHLHLVEPRGRELLLRDALLALPCEGEGCEVDAGPCDELNYRDFDRDGYGLGRPARRCGAGWAPRGGDCAPWEGLRHPGAQELCNGLDDDCDGVVDRDDCTGWTAVASPTTVDLKLAAASSPSQLWVAGEGQVFQGGAAGFVDVSVGCPQVPLVLAAQPNGAMELAAEDALWRQELPGLGCEVRRPVEGALVSMLAFPVELVGARADGSVWRWPPGGVPTVTPGNLPADAQLVAMHGVDARRLVAVGRQGDAARAWTLGADGGWQEDRLWGGVAGLRFNAVWMFSESGAVAVGEDGAVAVRGRFGWSGASAGAEHDFTAVRAFASSRVYATTRAGVVLRRAGFGWAPVTSAPGPLRALTGTTEEGLWAVGDDGVILRGPR